MSLILPRTRETTTTTGTGDVTLAGAVAQFQTFNSAASTGPRFYYWIVDADGTDWEFGIGYLDTIEQTRRAAHTESEKRIADAVQHAEDALVSARTALEAYARVARDQSDRGAIATMAAFVYRPLKAKVAELKGVRRE